MHTHTHTHPHTDPHTHTEVIILIVVLGKVVACAWQIHIEEEIRKSNEQNRGKIWSFLDSGIVEVSV